MKKFKFLVLIPVKYFVSNTGFELNQFRKFTTISVPEKFPKQPSFLNIILKNKSDINIVFI